VPSFILSGAPKFHQSGTKLGTAVEQRRRHDKPFAYRFGPVNPDFGVVDLHLVDDERI
jgi:hypothetical protein